MARGKAPLQDDLFVPGEWRELVLPAREDPGLPERVVLQPVPGLSHVAQCCRCEAVSTVYNEALAAPMCRSCDSKWRAEQMEECRDLKYGYATCRVCKEERSQLHSAILGPVCFRCHKEHLEKLNTKGGE